MTGFISKVTKIGVKNFDQVSPRATYGSNQLTGLQKCCFKDEILMASSFNNLHLMCQ